MPATEHLAFALTLIVAVGMLMQWLAWRLHLPAILFLLGAGLAAGPLGGWLDPDALFGELLFPFVSLAVALILFEGSLTLHWDQIRGVERVVRNLVSIGAAVTWLVVAAGAHWLTDLPWDLALLFGALVTVTGPTVVVPMLRTLRASRHVASVLRWEGIIIDPVGALLAVLVYEYIASRQGGHSLLLFGQAIAVGAGAGMLGGWLWAQVLRRQLLPAYLVNGCTLAWVLAVFSGANELVEESGLLAVTLMGLVLANSRGVDTEDILDFKETLSVLLISILFVVLAARMDASTLIDQGWGALALFGVVVLVARPLMVALSSLGSSLSWRERALIAWIAPRGIVAAAVSSLFAIRLEAQGIAAAGVLVALTFMVIIGTVVLQSLTAAPLASALGVREPEPRGLLIVGGNRVARAIGVALRQQGFTVLITDTSWENIREARMAGLSTYFGNAVSEHADRHLELIGIGHCLAMSQRPALNALACLRYAREFGVDNVYSLKMPEEKDESAKLNLAQRFRPRRLFGEEVTYAKLASLLSRDFRIRVTRLTDTFGHAAYQARADAQTIPLFAVDRGGRLRVFTPDRQLRPESGWTLVALARVESAVQSDGTAAA